MNLRPLLANVGFACLNARHARRFRRALDNPREAQERLLKEYLRRNADTVFGRRHGFRSIDSIDEYRDRVPVGDYDDYAELIDRVARGEPAVLTAESVDVLEWSGGSTRAAKLIPFTASLRTEFRRAIGAWVHALFRERPEIMTGPAYWSISPAHDAPQVDGAVVPVGPLEDSQYLGGPVARLVEASLAVPGRVSAIREVELHRRATLLHLLACRDLRLISVWHPTFLTLLVSAMQAEWEDLLDRLTDGFDPGVEGAQVRSRPERARELRAVDPEDPSAIWPHLEVISCWTDASARLPADQLGRQFPGVVVQGKGLLATEGVVSIPFGARTPLAVSSHFLEFVDDEDRVWSAWELTEGASYSVLLTTGGGLYRYALRDRVTVDGFVGSTASIRFVGKEDTISDLRGEKLSEGFVRSVVDRVLSLHGVRTDFAMLAPRDTDPPGYVLYLSTDLDLPDAVAEELESGLRENPHYAHCVDLGQLLTAVVRTVGPEAAARYLTHLAGSGQRLGDVKPTSLSSRSDWAEVFLRDGSTGSRQVDPASEI